MSSTRCHRTDNARKRIDEIISTFPRRLLNDVPLINRIRTISMMVFMNCIAVWNEHHVEDSTSSLGKKIKFVMPKNRDITVASCLICAVYSANDASYYPIFPLDIVRYTTTDAMADTEFDRFKKRVFEFVAIIQENELATTESKALIPTFDYGMLINRVFNHVVLATPEYAYQANALFEKLIQEVHFDGRSSVFICILVLYHYLHAEECICGSRLRALTVTQKDALRSLVDAQIKNMRLNMDTIGEVNTRLRLLHDNVKS